MKEHFSKKYELKNLQREWVKEYQLKYFTERIDGFVSETMEREGQIRSRIEAFRDEELRQAFEDFQNVVGRFRTRGFERFWDNKKDAVPYATKIFKRIGPDLRIDFNSKK
ncbi:hypothetical protein GWN42_09360 [candidate division KSB1 bacterium]|nr:hypothetical protein [candidate division KSB1 bacterium]